MRTGTKLLAVLSVLALGVGVALMDQKEPEPSASTFPASDPSGTFQGGIERRLTTTLKPMNSEMVGGYQAVPNSDPGYKLPTAATSAFDRNSPPDLPASYQRTFSPFGTLRTEEEDDEVEEPIRDEPITELARRLEEPGVDAPLAPVPMQHKISDGDTLSKLAQRYLGSADRYLEIYTLNRDVLSSPDLLPIGTTIKIPRSAAAAPASDELKLMPIPPGTLRKNS